jgi:hypothetical protein
LLRIHVMSCSDHLGRTKRRAALLFVVVLIAAGLVHVATAWAAPAADVTLRMERFYDNAGRCYKLRFSGTIASQAANEYVTILRQECGSRSPTAIAGASTRAGGLWEAEPVSGARPEFDSSSYRARWNGRLSEPLTFRGKLQISLAELGRGRYRVAVSTDQKMKGRPVELQRLVGGQWRRLRSARLAPFRGDFAATFTVRRRGLSLRALVPARSAGPCYSATASQTFTSGAATGPGSGAAVIDRTLLCSIAMRGGIRLLELNASSQTPTGAAYFGLTTNWSPDAGLVSATTESLSLNPTRCTPTRLRVRLTTKNLEGGSAGPSEREFECETPSRVLVRIRAVFRSRAALETNRDFGYPMLIAGGEVKETSLAIRTQAGRPLAFASIHESGRARVFAAPSCISE